MSARAWIVAVVPWCVGVWLLARVPRPRPRTPSRPRPSVSVVVPARNEQGSLPGLLASLAIQDPLAGEVIVVDDDSDDGTAAAAVQKGARVVTAPPLPGGWLGKPWACHCGAGAATGEVLVFVDADVTLAPGALAAVVGEQRVRRGLVSVQPFHRTRRPYERLSAVCNLVSMMGSLAFTGPPRRGPSMAFGPCLVTDRADYEHIGGHAHPSVRGQRAEDVALARAYRSHDLPVTVFGGGDVVRFRMYPDGVGQLVEGWARSLGAGIRASSPLGGIATFVWVWGALVAAWGGLRSLAGGPHWGFDAAIYAAWAIQVAWMLRRIGRFGALTSVLFPVPLVAFVGLCAWSLLHAATRQPVRWRGRPIRAR